MVQFERRPRDSAATYVPVFEGSSGTTFRRSIRRLRSGLATPTQKPLALMKRIIKASSNEGDIVKEFKLYHYRAIPWGDTPSQSP